MYNVTITNNFPAEPWLQGISYVASLIRMLDPNLAKFVLGPAAYKTKHDFFQSSFGYFE